MLNSRLYPQCRKPGRFIIYAYVIPLRNGNYAQYIGQSDEYDVRRRNHRRDCGYAIDPTKANHYKYSESQFYGFINKNGGWDRVEMNGGHFEIIDKTDSDDEATKLETQYIKAIPRNHLCLNTERFPSPPCRRVERIDPRQKKITDLFKSAKNAI